MVNSRPKSRELRLWYILLGVTIVFLLGVIFFISANSSRIANAATWNPSGPIDPYNVPIANVVVRVRPSDGKVFIIGENAYGINKEGPSLYYMTSPNYTLQTLVKFPNSTTNSSRSARATFDKDSVLHVVWGERSGPNNSYEQWYVRVLANNSVSPSVTIPFGGNGEAFKPDIASTVFPYSGASKIYISRNIFNFSSNNYSQEVISSSDGGISWGGATDLIGNFTPSNASQSSSIAVAPNDDVFVVVKTEENNIEHVYGKARTGGVWKPRQELSPANNGSNVPVITAAADLNSNGYIFFVYAASSTLYSKKWNNATSTWSSTPSTYTAPGRPVGLDSVGTGDGSIWLSVQNLNLGQSYATSSDGGTSWSGGDITLDGISASTSIAWANNQMYAAWKSGYTVRLFSTPGGGYISTPTNLTTTINSPTQVTLNWSDNSANETGFVLERSTSPAFSIITTFNPLANAITFPDTSVTENGIYYYRIKAALPGGAFTGYSNVTPQVLIPLKTPTNLAKTGSTTTSVSLSWTDNSGVETAYKLERKTPSTNFSEIASNLAPGTTTYTDSGLSEGNQYTYRVRAFNSTSNNYSAYSSELNATTDLIAPGSLSAVSTSSTEVALSWQGLSTNESGYIIERSPTGVTNPNNSFVEVGRTQANILTFHDTGLTANNPYFYQVKAYNTFVSSGYTLIDQAKTGTDKPIDLAVTGVTSTSISLQFTDKSDNETQFEVFRRTLGGSYGANATFTIGANATAAPSPVSFTDPNALTPGTVYFYKVRAITVADPNGGPSSFSNESSAATTSGNAACVVSTTSNSGAGSLRAALTDAVNCNKSGGVITFSLTGSQTIAVATALPDVAIGASIGGSCGSSGANIRLDAQTTAATLVLKGNNTVYGLQLRNAVLGGKPVSMGGTGIKMSCVTLLRT